MLRPRPVIIVNNYNCACSGCRYCGDEGVAQQDFKLGEKVTVLKPGGDRENLHFHGVRGGKMALDVASLPVDCLRDVATDASSVASDRLFSARSEGKLKVF